MKLTWIFTLVCVVSLCNFGETASLKSLLGDKQAVGQLDSIFSGENGHLLFFEFLEQVMKGGVGITKEDFLRYFDV